ncbi:glycine cleavage system protein H [bacterium]|nr:glycine cleavage system protein H [bacterium]
MKSIQKSKEAGSGGKICIWEQAGVMSQPECQEEFQCGRCEIDREMSKIAKRNSQLRSEGKKITGKNKDVVFWKDKLRELPLAKRPCQHYLKRQIPYRNCTNDYHCRNCAFDQYFSDQYAVYAVIKPIDELDIEGIKIPQGYYYHRGHTWVKLEENSEVRIGIDDFAYSLLGPPDRIEVPLIGKTVDQNRPEILLIRGENQVQLQSPVSGIVTAINSHLRENAADAYEHPYTDGWLMRVHVPGLRENLKQLMLGSEIKDSVKKQIDLLFEIIERDVQPLAADGGHLKRDIYGALPQLGWEQLTRTFLS